MALGPALPIIVSTGLGTANPFLKDYIPIAVGVAPPTVSDSILHYLNDGRFDNIEMVNGGIITDRGQPNGIGLTSNAGGGGVYLDDFSSTGIYLEDRSSNSSGIYILSGDSRPAFAGGVFIDQAGLDSVGIYLTERSSSGNAEILLETTNADIRHHARGLTKRVRFQASNLPPIVEAPASPTLNASLEVVSFGGAGVPAIAVSNVTNGAGALAATLANSPVAGNPAIWVPELVNGVVRYSPKW